MPPAQPTQGDVGNSIPNEWPDPQPLPDQLPPVEEFSPILLPGALGPWIEDITDRMQCPPDFPAVAAMVGLAGIVGRQIAIHPKRKDNWQVVPNLWGCCIGRPGIMKTPAIQGPLSLNQRLEIAAKEAHERKNRDFEAESMVAKVRRDVGRKNIEKAVKENGDAKAVAISFLAEESAAPVRRRYLLSDPTVEKLGEILSQNPRGVTIYRDELIGLLKSLDREGQEASRAFYLEAWDGTGGFVFDRIGRGTIDIEAVCVSIIGGIQPGPLSQYLRGAMRSGAGDDGLMQRFQLAVWPDVSKDWRNVDRWPDTDAKQLAFEVAARLDSLDPIRIGANEDDRGIPFLRFDDEAQEAFDEYRFKLEIKMRGDDEHPAMESHLSKYRSLLPSLALLCHLADVGHGPVGIDALGRAVAWAHYLECHARRIYSSQIAANVVAAKSLAKKIQKGDLSSQFSVREVHRKGWSGLSTSEDVTEAVELLEDCGWVRLEERWTGGRPTRICTVNPKVVRTPPPQTDETDEIPF
jgi:putative DNA primase/helicase